MRGKAGGRNGMHSYRPGGWRASVRLDACCLDLAGEVIVREPNVPARASEGMLRIFRLEPSGRGLQVVAVEVHDLVPCSDEVLNECLLRVAACIDFGNCPELRV
jgi:hypothetical protein